MKIHPSEDVLGTMLDTLSKQVSKPVVSPLFTKARRIWNPTIPAGPQLMTPSAFPNVLKKLSDPRLPNLADYKSAVAAISNMATGANLLSGEARPLYAPQARARGRTQGPEKDKPDINFSAKQPARFPDGAQFLQKSFSTSEGTRPYKLYIPSNYQGRPSPLIVMLHGCTQSANDFAAGTGMNMLAEEFGFFVVYPEQTTSANMQKCWNWFNAADQVRGTGEPSILAGITLEVMNDYAISRTQVYVAGLSAGGAAAAIMGHTYPDIYAAIGVHSGIPCGAAQNITSAFTAMRGEGHSLSLTPRSNELKVLPTIVFHGDLDSTVSPRNSDAVIAQAARGVDLSTCTNGGAAPGGLDFSQTKYFDESLQVVIEKWIIHGAGHAWSGGSSAGSYTEARGIDASREMVRFFLEHPKTI